MLLLDKVLLALLIKAAAAVVQVLLDQQVQHSLAVRVVQV
jgi:hypothetical protein